MAAVERQARAPVGFVAASSGPEGGKAPSLDKSDKTTSNGAANPDAIDLDEDMNEDEE